MILTEELYDLYNIIITITSEKDGVKHELTLDAKIVNSTKTPIDLVTRMLMAFNLQPYPLGVKVGIRINGL